MTATAIEFNKKPRFEFSTKCKKREDIPKNQQEAFQKSLLEWVIFWRENPHRFIEDYLQIKLRNFQKVLIVEFSKNQNTIMIATRGIGKSFITALYACAIAILYPNSNIVIACGVKSQAKTFVSEKIKKQLYNMSPMLRKEIEDFEKESEMVTVKFRNGSSIVATNASENRRGFRATLLIVDEAVMVDKNVLESVLQPFLNVVRDRPYCNYPQYATHVDSIENQTIYLTSAWFKAHYFYNDYYTQYIKDMLRGKKYRVFNLSYETSIRNQLLPRTRVEDARNTMDTMTFQMEYESIFYGENGDSFFKSAEINNCRTLTDVFYPPDNLEYMTYKFTKQYTYPLPKKENDIRVLSADIALMAGRNNDNSVYTLLNMSRKNNDHQIKLEHIEAHNGMEAEEQAVLIKRLFYDYECNRMIIDANGVGMTVFNELKKETVDTEREIVYPAWGVYNDETAIPEMEIDDVHYVMYAMKAGADTNHKIALEVKGDLRSNKLILPAMENDARYYLEQNYYLSTLSSELQVRLMLPYIETSLLFTEMIGLDYTINNGKIQIKEKGSSRKDRYSSLGYGVFLCHEILAEMENDDDKDTFIFLT